MKYAAAITLYNPTLQQIKHCYDYKNSFDCVFILDNSDDTSISNRDAFLSEEFIYIRMNGNEGLPKAFNSVLNNERIGEYDFLCTLDQDSIFRIEEIYKIRSFIEDCYNDIVEGIEYSRVGIFAPVIDYGRGNNITKEYEERQRVITSGAFLKLNLLLEQNIRYDELYFIDKFEIDLCQQLISRGYQIIVYSKSTLEQQLGDGDRSKHSSHNYLRHYYLFRNRFYFNRKYYKGLKKICLNMLQTMRHSLEIIVYEPDKSRKLRQLFPAYIDYKNNRMGKRA